MHALTAIALTLLALLAAPPAGAAIYSYKDANGRTVFVDDAQKIPAQYRDKTSTIQEQRDIGQEAAEESTEGDKAETGAGAGAGAGAGTGAGSVTGTGAVAEETEAEGQVIIDRDTQRKARQQVEILDRQRAHQTPVMVRGNRVLVPVEIAVGNRISHLMLLLDTGATHTVLHRSSVKDLPFQSGQQISAKVAGGRTVKSEKVTVRYLDIGPFELKEFPVLLITPQGPPLPFDGLLGMDFLKDHPYEVDYDNEMIRWKPANL